MGCVGGSHIREVSTKGRSCALSPTISAKELSVRVWEFTYLRYRGIYSPPSFGNLHLSRNTISSTALLAQGASQKASIAIHDELSMSFRKTAAPIVNDHSP